MISKRWRGAYAGFHCLDKSWLIRIRELERERFSITRQFTAYYGLLAPLGSVLRRHLIVASPFVCDTLIYSPATTVETNYPETAWLGFTHLRFLLSYLLYAWRLWR